MLNIHFFIFSFFTATSLLAQTQKIDEGSWFLHNLIINSENNFNPKDIYGDQVVSQFSTLNMLSQSFETYFCDVVSVYIGYDPEKTTFKVISTATTLGCGPPDTPLIENKFSNFFSSEVSSMSDFTYQIVEENLDSPKTLTITAPNGDKAIYTRTVLSTKEIFDSIAFIYPNPIKDVMFIEFFNKSKIFDAQIYDFTGKLVLNQILQNSNSINTEKLVSGMYIILIKDSLGNGFQKKFVKQ